MNIQKSLSLACVTLLLSAAALSAQESLRQRIAADPLVAAGNNNEYPAPDPRQTQPKAPEGFKPFYISHYSRHGSRWLISEKDYSVPRDLLHEEFGKDNLTALGEDVMQRLDIVCEAAEGRYEELTPKGAQQHREIARRMFRNYPELLGGNAKVRARSTIVIRCILSMNAFTNALSGCNPSLEIDSDASKHDMYYMNWYNPDGLVPDVDLSGLTDSLRKATLKADRFLASIFRNPEGIDEEFYSDMYMICGNVQGTTASGISFWDLFTTDELYSLFYCYNAQWYFNHGNSPAKNKQRPFVQTNLLRKIIAQADEAVNGGEYAADLRFGHDGNISSLVTLMNLNGLGASVEEIDRISEVWNISDIIPMAANLQMVFYRNRAGEVIVHFDLNEREATLPVGTYHPKGKDRAGTGCFYLWKDVKSYWNGILEASPVK
ncbi:MAG: histidine phosphatase family protein [Candidatus Cryptobacteroides sp.]